jgi:hypothetical protein
VIQAAEPPKVVFAASVRSGTKGGIILLMLIALLHYLLRQLVVGCVFRGRAALTFAVEESERVCSGHAAETFFLRNATK